MFKKIIIILILINFYSCDNVPVEKANVNISEKFPIGNELYLKQISVEYGYEGGSICDKIYIIVNENDKIVSGTTVNYKVGKQSATLTSLIYKKDSLEQILSLKSQIDSLNNLLNK
jgi:hypothetical protein